jgi:hypothetical protein
MRNLIVLGSFVILVVCVFAQACGKPLPQETEGANDSSQANNYVSADNPNAHITDEVLLALKGRWVKENNDPVTADPPTMRLFARGDNLLGGRFLVAGGFNDTGVAATLKAEGGGSYTMILHDDEMRPHEWIPRDREFTGKYDPAEKTLELKTKDGEWVKWKLSGGFKVQYSANIFRCTLVATPLPGDGPSGGSGGSSTSSGSSSGSSSGGWGSDSSSGSSRGSHRSRDPIPDDFPTRTRHHLVNVAEEVVDISAATPPTYTPNPRATFAPNTLPAGASGMSGLSRTPKSSFNNCGVMSSYEDDWNRMSGA